MKEPSILSLENDLLQVLIAPDFGGKITSLRSLRTGEEFFLPPLKDYRRVSSPARFSEGDGGGFDECLPSVAACESIRGEPPVPDHGDLWRLLWNVDSEHSPIVMRANALSRPLRLTRRAMLEGASLVLEYELENLSDASATWLWSAHPLLRVESGDRIILPDEIEQVLVESCASGLFATHSSIPWPVARSASGSFTDLSRVGDPDGVTANKFFACVGKSGWAALYRKRIGQGLVFRFAPSSLPFLGIWTCLGAWPEDGIAKQYAVALEPSTSNADSLTSAVRNGAACSLDGGNLCLWRLEIQLLGASTFLDIEEFRAGASAPGNRENHPNAYRSPFLTSLRA